MDMEETVAILFACMIQTYTVAVLIEIEILQFTGKRIHIHIVDRKHSRVQLTGTGIARERGRGQTPLVRGQIPLYTFILPQ